MKLRADITINGVLHPKGSQVPWHFIYPFFMLHMLMFGGSGFFMAYASDVDLIFLYLHGGIAISVYLIFYLAIFGFDEVKWMLINALLGVFGIYTQIGWLLKQFGKEISDFPYYIHITPFFYVVLYTFLLRQALVDLSGARSDASKSERASWIFVFLSLSIDMILLRWQGLI